MDMSRNTNKDKNEEKNKNKNPLHLDLTKVKCKVILFLLNCQNIKISLHNQMSNNHSLTVMIRNNQTLS